MCVFHVFWAERPSHQGTGMCVFSLAAGFQDAFISACDRGGRCLTGVCRDSDSPHTHAGERPNLTSHWTLKTFITLGFLSYLLKENWNMVACASHWSPVHGGRGWQAHPIHFREPARPGGLPLAHSETLTEDPARWPQSLPSLARRI